MGWEFGRRPSGKPHAGQWEPARKVQAHARRQHGKAARRASGGRSGGQDDAEGCTLLALAALAIVAVPVILAALGVL